MSQYYLIHVRTDGQTWSGLIAQYIRYKTVSTSEMPYIRRRVRTGRKFYRTGYKKLTKVFIGKRYSSDAYRGVRRAMDT